MQQKFTRESKYADLALYTRVLSSLSGTQSPQTARRTITKIRGLLITRLHLRRFAASTLLMYILSSHFTQANAEEIRIHTVRAGETLSLIAKSIGVSYRYLACLNHLRNPDRIKVGQHIVIPRSRREGPKFDFIWPVDQGWISSPFGPRHGHCHKGVDIAAPIGTPVRAAAMGKVVFSGRQGTYGNVVIIKHPNGYHTVYAHLKKIYVKTNEDIRCGQRIALVGSTGRSTGPHLHFEVRENRKERNPMAFLPLETPIVLNPKAFYGTGIGGN